MAYMTDGDKNFIRENAMHLGITGLSRQLGFHTNTIRNFCIKENIVYRGKHNSFNEHFFEVIDTEEKAYILGLWYADGYVFSPRKKRKEQRSFGISLNIKDEDILQKIKTAMSATHPINIYEQNSNFGHSVCGRIIFTSDKAVQHLESLGCVTHKTDVLIFPSDSQVPEHLVGHFIRGYFDGDGSLSYWIDNQKTLHRKYSMSICGTKEMLQGIQSYFKTSVKLGQRHPDRDTNNYSLTYCGNQQIFRLMNAIYTDAHIYLDRKYENYTELKKYVERQGINGRRDSHISFSYCLHPPLFPFLFGKRACISYFSPLYDGQEKW